MDWSLVRRFRVLLYVMAGVYAAISVVALTIGLRHDYPNLVLIGGLFAVFAAYVAIMTRLKSSPSEP